MGNWQSSAAAEAAPLSFSFPTGEPANEAERLQKNLLDVLNELKVANQDVNIVITSPIGISAHQYCERFCQSYTMELFRYMEIRTMLSRAHASDLERGLLTANSYLDCITRLDDQRKKSLKQQAEASSSNGAGPSVTMLYLNALMREMLVYLLEYDNTVLRASQAAEEGERKQAKFCLYYQHAEDYAIAMARSARQLNLISESELQCLETLADVVWRLGSRRRPAHTTLYVYLRYTDECYLTEYDKTCNSGTQKRHEVAVMQQMRTLALRSKQHMDALYTEPKNDIVKNYFSLVMQFDSNDLRKPLHGTLCTYQILQMVRTLQQLRIWQAPDTERIAFLQGIKWMAMRRLHIQSRLAVPKDYKQPTPEERAKEIQDGPPLPHAEPVATPLSPPASVSVEPHASTPSPSFGSGRVPRKVSGL
jgi:hypothetical protein